MSDTTLAENIIAEARGELAACLATVRHCLGQLDDGQVWRRPRESMNSVGELVLHLCGNLRRRLLSVVGGLPDDRDRPKELAKRGLVPKAQLLLRLEEAAGGADAVLAGLTAARLLEGRRYRGVRGEVGGTVLAVVLRTLLHLGGHAREVVCATRLQLGDAYTFRSSLPSPAAGGETVAADDVVFERGMLPAHAPASPAEANPTTPGATPAYAAASPPGDSPLKDHLLELEQEFQDQQDEGKL